MKKRLFSFLLALFFALSVSAQNKEARKIGELNSFWECEFVRTSLDNFFFDLQNDSQATGFVITYEGKYSEKIYDNKGNSKTKTYLPRVGEAAYRIQTIRNHIKFRNFSPDRILFIDGGFREEHKVEFWIVPNGTELPKPKPTLEEMKYRKGKSFWKCDEAF